ncbi:isochorismate synthase MenF [Actinomyces sp.]|uniref:isochorismate synthase n=1 Tax=Actinomyces sp. TaxID=29317 RepID=UPI0026DB51C4|nr:isochorismate synthase [Actinomyces sp.]MDO4899314.1 isochorismate synthase [Actinomyces sp.]
MSFRTVALPVGVITAEGGDDGTGLLDLLARREDVVSWVRRGHGLVGWGQALRLEAQGPDRIEALRSAWRATVYASWWRDALVRPGTGPVALGTIAFSPTSAAVSVLTVPRVLVGLDDSGAWLTTAVVEGEAHPEVAEVLARLRPPASAPPDVPSPDVCVVAAGALPEAEYLAAVAQVRRRIAAGEASKVVLARDLLVTPAAPLATGDLLRHLEANYPSCWTFAVDSTVGATPELLVRLENRHLASRVLAGTARRHPGDAAAREREAERLGRWLAASPKNRAEHELARASAITALEPLCSAVVAKAPRVLTLPNVLHLATDITGVVAGDTGALALVRALHPTAAVCGTPTEAAARIIAEVEGMDRGRYAGPVGWVDWHGEGEWCIALRSAALPPGGVGPEAPARIFGGGGIMPDSVPVDELAETQAKMRPMLTALGADVSPPLP